MTRRRSPADRRDRAGLAPSIDLLVTGHTHLPYTCDIPDPAGRSRWVTSASSFDRVITETELQLDRRTRDVVRSSVTSRNHAVTRDVPADPAQTATIARWSDLSAPVADRPVGSITGAVTRSASRDTESSLADLIADAQLVAGGRGRRHRHLRRDVHGPAPRQPARVHDPPRAQMDTLLEHQWSAYPSRRPRTWGSPSRAFSWWASAPVGQKVDPTSITLNGAPIDPAATYRVTVNSFLADGEDGFTVLTEGTDRVGGGRRSRRLRRLPDRQLAGHRAGADQGDAAAVARAHRSPSRRTGS